MKFKFYERAKIRCRQGTASESEIKEVSEFERAQTEMCHYCSTMVFDPFGFRQVIHDIENCRLKP